MDYLKLVALFLVWVGKGVVSLIMGIIGLSFIFWPIWVAVLSPDLGNTYRFNSHSSIEEKCEHQPNTIIIELDSKSDSTHTIELNIKPKK